MAPMLPLSQSHSFSVIKPTSRVPKSIHVPSSFLLLKKSSILYSQLSLSSTLTGRRHTVVVAATTTNMSKKPAKGGFVGEMRAAAMKLHTRDQAREGEKEPESPAIAKLEPSINGYLRFLVDSKLVFDTLEAIVEKAPHPSYAELRNTGLERSEALKKDLEWLKEQGHTVPEPSSPGISYTRYLKELPEKDPQAFICHFYMVYFGHAGGRQMDKQASEMILDKKELEFYKWEDDVPKMLQNVRDKLNEVASNWSREQQDHCVEETEISFNYYGEIIHLIFS